MDISRRQSFPYLIRTVNRHGTVCWYFWRRPGPKIRVRGEYGTPEFRENYWQAASGDFLSKPRSPELAQPIVQFRQKIGHAIERAVLRARKRAKAKGLGCDINYEWAMARVIENDHRCEMTRIPFFDPSGDGHRIHPFAPTIDRIDTTLGYTQVNSRVVSCAFNVGMNSWGADVFDMVTAAFQKKVKALVS